MAVLGEAQLYSLCLILSLTTLLVQADLYLRGTEISYARFPKWDACINASISFEFKTTQEEGLLMYVDDGGKYDFIEVMQVVGQVKVVLNIVDGRDGNVKLDVGHNVNDGRWHRVEIRRNRMETTLIVDGASLSDVSYGSDFYFGNVTTNSEVYFGGLPVELNEDLHSLALPSVLFQSRFKGSIRNVLYGNCTCQTKRARILSSIGADIFPREACETHNPCREGCLCISTDTEAACDCTQLQCVTAVMHYQLPMDLLLGSTLINPSGLDATAFGNPLLIRGIRNRAIRLNGRDTYARVAGSGHRYECFGDLDLCNQGYTIAFWVNFEKPCDREAVYLSNGGHSEESYGVAMLYDRGNMEFRFRRKNGQEWRVTSDDVLPGRWYHVAAAWSLENGLSLYVDGDLVNTHMSPIVRSPEAVVDRFKEFIVGRSNDGTPQADACTMLMDEFNFWSMLKTPAEIKELAKQFMKERHRRTDLDSSCPFYCYRMPMDSFRGGEVIASKLKATIHGKPTKIKGKIEGAVLFDGSQDYIDGGDQSSTCLGDLSLCQFGLTFASWVRFNQLQENTYFLSTGNKGIKIYYKHGKLTAEVQQGNKNWQVSWNNPLTGVWYFLEVSWNAEDGLRMFVDLEELSHTTNSVIKEPKEGNSNLYVGRANAQMHTAKFAAASFDEMELCYGDRDRLIFFDFLQRGRPSRYKFHMDAIAGDRLLHPSLSVNLNGNPSLVSGKINNALRLNGNNQYADVGEHPQNCLGNLDRCRHGLLLSSWIRAGQLKSKMNLLSTGANGVKVWYEGGQLMVSVETSTRMWQASTNKLSSGQWQFLDISWHKDRGLALYINNELVATAKKATLRARSDAHASQAERGNFYIGRGDGRHPDRNTANATYDEAEYWYGSREYLLAFDYIQRGKPQRYLFDMDAIFNGKLVHPSMDIPVSGGPKTTPGKINRAVRLDGNGQYIDVGEHSDSCLGNLQRCKHGVSGSMWANFRRFEKNTYYLTSGNGIKIYSRNRRLHVVFATPDREWDVVLSDLHPDQWYFLEYTWHPERGLKIYLNNRLVGSTRHATKTTGRPHPGINHYYIGRANPGEAEGGRFRYADFLVDEVETWYGEREQLLAFNHIIRDNVTHVMIPFERQEGNTVVHPDVNIILHEGAAVKKSRIGNALELRGSGQYVTLGDQGEVCMGNLEKCLHGLTLSFYVKPDRLTEEAYLMSTGPYSIFYKDGKLNAVFRTSRKTWAVSSDKFAAHKWQKVLVSWDEERGLKLYIDGNEVASTKDYNSHAARKISDHTVYLGRPNRNTYGHYFNGTIDEMEIWYADRDHLVAFGLLDKDVKRVVINMDEIVGDMITHPSQLIYVHGNPRVVRGKDKNAIYLNGRRQYIDAGKDLICEGDLENCEKGFTLRFQVKPNELRDNTYLMSSAPVDVYYKDGKVVADFKTHRKLWTVSTDNVETDEWQRIELSWDPVDGVVIYVNGKEQDSSRVAVVNREHYDVNKRFYIGRANTDMIKEKYSNIVVDDVELWEAKREYLIAHHLIDEDTGEVIVRTTASPIQSSTLRPVDGTMLYFNGDSWVKYDFNELPDDVLRHNEREEIHIRFKTDEPNGLIYYTGVDQRNIHLSLKRGQLVLETKYPYGQDKIETSSDTGRFHDNEFHDVYIKRDGRQLKLVVDGKEYVLDLSGDVEILTYAPVYLGGSDNVRTLTDGSVRKNFVGTIDESLITGNNLRENYNLIELFLKHPRPRYVTVNGRPASTNKTKEETTKEITFTTKASFLRLPQWDARRTSKVSFKFKTVEPDGLMLFNGGRRGSRNFVAIEMYDGIPYFVINLGDRVNRIPFTRTPVNDGKPHYIEVHREGKRVIMTLDDSTEKHLLDTEKEDLILGTFLYVGGAEQTSQLPWNLWTRENRFYLGCLWDLKINTKETDLHRYVKGQVNTGVELGCKKMPIDCRTEPCVNGVCREFWTQYVCDCSETAFTGKRCSDPAPIIAFYGNDWLKFEIYPTLVTHTNDISLRFKTLKEDGLLFSTSNPSNSDYIRVSLDNGRGKVETRLGGETKVMYFCEDLNDDEWHTLHMKRQANYFEVWADECPHTKAKLLAEGFTLDIDKIMVASLGPDADPKDNFVGHMQNFKDVHRYFDFLDSDLRPTGISVTNKAKIGYKEVSMPLHPVTFRSGTNSYLTFATPVIPDQMNLKFTFKTKEPDGLILYNKGRSGDFIAVELVKGFINFAFDDGGGPEVVRAKSKQALNDEEWHTVTIKKTNNKHYVIDVDGTQTDLEVDEGRDRLDLSGVLYTGGVKEDMYPTLPEVIQSRRGFAGCFATLRISRRIFNLMTDAYEIGPFVRPGCVNATAFCKTEPCKHFGVCHEGFDTFICDCNMTSFVGRTCTDEAEGYYFGGKADNMGISVFNIDERQDTDIDKLAFGFMTWYPNGTLVRIDSGTSVDYFEAKMENGSVVVVYNVGDGERRLVEDRRRFNNGRYHYVRFVRNGANATLRVDEYPMKSYVSTLDGGTTGRVFNDMAVVKLGGRLDHEENIYSWFNGILSGVYLNGWRIVDLNQRNDARIAKSGDTVYAQHLFHVRLIPPKPEPTLPERGTGANVVEGGIIKGDGEAGVGVGTGGETDKGGEEIVGEVVVPKGGGGVAWKPVAGGEIGVDPGGIKEGVGVGVGGGGGVPPGGVVPPAGGGPVAAAVSGGAGVGGGSGEGARAAAAAGTMLGLLAAASSIVWAVYKFKPGLLSGAGGGGGGATPMQISAPRATTNYQALLQTQAAGGLGGGRGGAGGGGGGAAGSTAKITNITLTKTDTMNGAAGMGGGGGGSGYGHAATQTSIQGANGAAFSSYFSSMSNYAMSSSAAGAISGLTAGAGSVTRATQTDMAYGGAGSGYGASGSAMAYTGTGAGYAAGGYAGGYGGSGFSETTTTTTTMMESTQSGGGAGGSAVQVVTVPAPPPSVATAETQTLPPPPPPAQPLVQPAAGYGAGYGYGESSSTYNYQESYSATDGLVQSNVQQRAYQPSPVPVAAMQRSLSPPPLVGGSSMSSESYQMQNLSLIGAGGQPLQQRPNVYMASEEIRVDCVMMSSNGQYVVTGSIYGPPQVWDMRTGELVQVMQGEDLSSTDLHLACNDTLLVGQVAEMTQVDPNDVEATRRIHPRKLQLWDFHTGRPLEMDRNELCTASRMMNDGERIVLGRTGMFGSGTSIVIWDLMGNEAVRKLNYDAAIGFADHISYLNISTDNRYVVAGFQNSYDGNANFLIFDLALDDRQNNEPKVLALDAQAECTAILDNHEAITGTRKGELAIWSMRTGKLLRQLVMPRSGTQSLSRMGVTASTAHAREVKAVSVSKDRRFLVSGSSDATLKIWSLESEKLLNTLSGHTDEVWCCSLSDDNEFVVSGSRDNTIRLWRVQNALPVCLFNTGMNVFSVKLSADKKTIVALGDRFSSRKLIMLRVVHTKTRSRAGSRATSPLHPVAEPYRY